MDNWLWCSSLCSGFWVNCLIVLRIVFLFSNRFGVKVLIVGSTKVFLAVKRIGWVEGGCGCRLV